VDVDDAIAGRRAVRQYTREAVARDLILHLIDAAVHAPSAVNQQPWTFTVIRDPGVLDRISEEAKRHLLASAGNAAGAADRFRAQFEDPGFHVFYHAPVLVLISAAAAGPWIVEDCALAAENLMLAAHAAGLGTCWIGVAQGYLGSAEGKRALGLPDAWMPVAPIIVGHAAAPAPAVPRNAPQIHWIG